jgi:hypothetical protein
MLETARGNGQPGETHEVGEPIRVFVIGPPEQLMGGCA